MSDPADWSPPWSWVEAVAARVPCTAAKVAPGVLGRDDVRRRVHHLDLGRRPLVEAEIARARTLRTGRSRRRARVVCADDVVVSESAQDLDAETPPPVGPVGAWLHEPDDAVIRAGLVGEVVDRLAGRLLDPHVAYVSTDQGNCSAR